MRLLGGAILALVLAIQCFGQADQDPDKSPLCDRVGSKLQLTTADTTILGITIGRSSFADIEAKLGPVQTSPRNTICYISPVDGTVLTFRTGPMGGFQFVTQFGLWSREANFPTSKACTPSQLVSRNVSTDTGIRLGLTTQELNRVAGKQPKLDSSHGTYHYLCRERMTDAEVTRMDATEFPYWFVTSSLEAWLTASRATHVEVGKFSSY
jgi:hypothetical protein